MFDVAVVGAGPAGSACAAFCAAAGLRTVLLEREKFPREKVCGDCLNPACWPVLERLQVAHRVRELPHGTLERVEFIAIGGRSVSVALPRDAEIAVKRSYLDDLLLTRARERGCEVRDGITVTSLTYNKARWTIRAGSAAIEARLLVAADGRNSTVARSLGLLPRIEKERVAWQTHLPLPRDFGNRVVLQFLPQGYSGQAPVGEDQLNVCLVGKPADMQALRRWAESQFEIPRDQNWRTITPLRRGALSPVHENLFLIGDAARVVEPFTGEGIYYALHSGELAAGAAVALLATGRHDFAAAHERLYRGRLWVNRLARAAVLSPRVTSTLLRAGCLPAPLLSRLTAKIVRQ